MEDNIYESFIIWFFPKKINSNWFLYDNPYQKLTTIQEHFQYNHTTLLNDLADLNSIISPCEIIKTANLEYFLHFPNNTNIEYVYSCFLQVAPEFRLLQQLIFNTYPSTEALAEALYVSNSTVKRMITRINQILLEKFSFKIQTSPLTFSGDETKIINFFIAFLKESYVTSTQLLSKEQNIFLINYLRSLYLFSNLLETLISINLVFMSIQSCLDLNK